MIEDAIRYDDCDFTHLLRRDLDLIGLLFCLLSNELNHLLYLPLHLRKFGAW